MKTLEHHLQNLYQSHLEDFELKLSDERIILKAKASETEQEVVFEGVKAFFYANPTVVSPELLADVDANAISSIVFCKKGFGEFAIVHSRDGRTPVGEPISVSVPNFNLCFGEASFFIEAKSVTINDQKFNLKPIH